MHIDALTHSNTYTYQQTRHVLVQTLIKNLNGYLRYLAGRNLYFSCNRERKLCMRIHITDFVQVHLVFRWVLIRSSEVRITTIAISTTHLHIIGRNSVLRGELPFCKTMYHCQDGYAYTAISISSNIHKWRKLSFYRIFKCFAPSVQWRFRFDNDYRSHSPRSRLQRSIKYGLP